MIAADFAAAVSAEACEDGNSPPELLLGAASADISQWLVRMVIHQHLFLVLQLLQWLQVRMMADQQQHNLNLLHGHWKICLGTSRYF